MLKLCKNELTQETHKITAQNSLLYTTAWPSIKIPVICSNFVGLFDGFAQNVGFFAKSNQNR